MYESFFQLRERPFAASPRIDRYYPGQAAEAARLSTARCIERAEGYAVILGTSGTGKTLLCQVLAEQFRNTLTPVLLSGGALTSRKAMLQGILFELGLPFKRRDEGEMRLALLDRIARGRDKSDGLLVLVDEAQTLPARLFEELRLLSNVVREGKTRVRLAFAGAPSLEERLAHPKLTAFHQRIAVRSTLRPFSTAETQEYVRAQTAVVGGDPDAIWAEDALTAIYQTTDGVPRLINQVCDYALLLAAAGGVTQLHAHGVDEAWADLQQLPLPSAQTVLQYRDPAADGCESETVIEFGSLDDALDGKAEPMVSVPAENRNDYVPTASGETEEELVFGNLQQPEASDLPEPTEHLESEVAKEMIHASSKVELEAVYDDYPIIPRVKHSTETVEPDAEFAAPTGVDESTGDDVDDWVPVPIVQGPLWVSPRGPHVEDRVLPDGASEPKVVPMRSFAAGPFSTTPIVATENCGQASGRFANVETDDRDDIVHEEEVPSPTYYPGERSGWAVAATAVATAQKPSAASKPLRRPKRRRVFGQLFTQLRKQ